ncbi:MAG: type II toxin-antitoxin system CcdA family antitoxin [Candidatus Rifleibacteriota bacterium]
MSVLYNINSPKKATNLTINSELLGLAKKLNINISSVLEKALAEVVKQKKKEQWLKTNKKAIDIYNETINDHGLFSDEMRTF